MNNTLIAEHLPLEGQHLIEASAGTGKTYNITRIYLRLLLEKKLTVQQILVMTFTKDATEELRGRIENFIRQALTQWQTFEKEDAYFQVIAERVSEPERLLLLNRALVNIDEAAIFTIHSFCKRVLNQHAFLSGVSFSAQMEVDSKEYVIEICRDWYRQLANQSPEKYMAIAGYWPTPESLIRQFNKAINHYCLLDIIDEEKIKLSFFAQVKEVLKTIDNNIALLTTYLIDSKKGAEKTKRQTELTHLIQWLSTASTDFSVIETKFPGDFLDGRRLPRSEIKVELSAALLPANNLKKAINTIIKAVSKAKALVIVQAGIYSMREQLNQLKQEKNILTFDDLISTLATQLNLANGIDDGTTGNATLASTLLKQFPAALVDEFQDTDPLQFDILSAIYHKQSDSSLFMIGDPKQAIYGFRGGDVFAYLNARAKCDQQWVMDTNWRSSKNMITGYNRLFYGNNLRENPRDVFGYNIAYHPVKASPKADDKQLVDLSFNALQFVHFESEDKTVPASYRQKLARWCANEITRLLYTKNESQPQIKAKDIAILVRDGTEAADIRAALNEANLACVYLSNRANLWQSEQSKQLLLVLKGICHAEDNHQFLASLTSPLLGIAPHSYVELLNDDIQWQSLAEHFIKLRSLWRSYGFITMALKLLHELFKFKPQQERELTNVLHLFELLQTVSQRLQQPEELVHWFEQQISQDFTEIEAELRLESEEDLVKIITQHGSKGLEYPIVFVPYATRHKDPLKVANTNVELIEYHQKDGGLTLSLDGSKEAKQAMSNEQYAESIRLLYVAVTRAEQRCYILTTNFDKSELSPLGQTLAWQAEQNIPESLAQLVTDNPESIGLISIKDEALPLTVAPDNVDLFNVKTAQFTGKIERNWWLSSFTALSRNLRDIGVSSPDRDLFESNSLSDEIYNAAELRFDLVKGAKTGNLLHDILEFVNFSHPNWEVAISSPLMRFGHLGNGYHETELISWLDQVIKTPLNMNHQASDLIDTVPNDSFCLAKLNHSQTLREAEFYFPLETASTKELTSLLSQHRLRVNNHFKSGQSIGLPPQVLLPNIATLQGMMHGFIDLIFEHNGKYYLCDYKSNHLGDNFSDYSPEKLSQSIQTHHYDLQYLIYSVALHRFLQQKLSDYSIEKHFGGIYYLYLRGMSPNSTNTGVYYCQLSHDELTQVDNVFSNEESHHILTKQSAQLNKEIK
ncbi:exodeoxyribonuclease V subunit beta [Thalassotalea profundi]|uniref:RecBCD enzyme subunit RecB n=1 Tax=Thalassotalea profundi TaxID=2036687 RepID=A0ABQ3ITW6_9GAMM|nr:exodeoxyribonuclease V subunit beta [Thalassotalea profundi]GHE91111.1 RecBCD enzyme subunit RecB [Thalassotalea profundi]